MGDKGRKFLICLLMDALGYVSLLFPVFDLIWAPVSAFVLTRMFPGARGRVAAIVQFIEEILPWTDFVPTFTIMFVVSLFVSDEKDGDSQLLDSDLIDKKR